MVLRHALRWYSESPSESHGVLVVSVQVSYRDDNHLDPKDKEYAPSSGGSGDEASEPELEPIDPDNDPLPPGKKQRKGTHPLPAVDPTSPHPPQTHQRMKDRAPPITTGNAPPQGMISPGGTMTGYPPGVYAPSGAYSQRSPNGPVILHNVRDAMNAPPGSGPPTWVHPAKQHPANVVSGQGASPPLNLDPSRWGKPSPHPQMGSPSKWSKQDLLKQWRYPKVGPGEGPDSGVQPNPPQWAPTAGAVMQYGMPMGPGQVAGQGGVNHHMTDPRTGPAAGQQLWSATGQRPPGPRGGQPPLQPTAAAHPLQGAAGHGGMRPAGLSTPAGVVRSGAGPQPPAAHPLQASAGMRPAGLTPSRVPAGSRPWRGPLMGAGPPPHSPHSSLPSEVLLQQLLDKANAVPPPATVAAGGANPAAAPPSLSSAGGVGAPTRTTPRRVTPQQLLQSQNPQGVLILALQEHDRRQYLEVSGPRSIALRPSWLACSAAELCCIMHQRPLR